MKQKLIFTNLVGQAIDSLVADLGNPQVVLVTDTNTAQFVLPVIVNDSKAAAAARQIIIKSGDSNKTLDELKNVWMQLADAEASRNTVVINVGGGVVSDLGGFASATFKRGLRYINVPTTVLGAVDAATGGKTGINFNGIKNQIGAFAEPEAAIISTIFFNTLPQQQILSGYAEMLKHGLLESPEVLGKLLTFSPVYPVFNSEAMMPLLKDSVMVKANIVGQDLTETGLRKALNLGHTVGHALEAFGIKHQNPIPHGYAVVWGLVTELILSHTLENFPSDEVHRFAQYVKTNYGLYPITCDDYPELIAAMRQDKKNADADSINFTLLKAIGEPVLNVVATPEQITAALDLYRDLMGLD